MLPDQSSNATVTVFLCSNRTTAFGSGEEGRRSTGGKGVKGMRELEREGEGVEGGRE